MLPIQLGKTPRNVSGTGQNLLEVKGKSPSVLKKFLLMMLITLPLGKLFFDEILCNFTQSF